MQNLDSVAQKTERVMLDLVLGAWRLRCLRPAVPVTNLRIELRASRQLKIPGKASDTYYNEVS